MLGSVTKDSIESAQKRIAELERDLRIEEFLYANLRDVLMKKQDEITQLNNIIDDLIRHNR